VIESLSSAEFAVDPYPVYRQMRQQCPLVWNEETGSYYIVTYAASVEILSSKLLRSRGIPPGVNDLSEDDRATILPTEQFFAEWMVFSDSTYHEVLRAALRPVLSPQDAASLARRMRVGQGRRLQVLLAIPSRLLRSPSHNVLSRRF
jgi:cytochrome P450